MRSVPPPPPPQLAMRAGGGKEPGTPPPHTHTPACEGSIDLQMSFRPPDPHFRLPCVPRGPRPGRSPARTMVDISGALALGRAPRQALPGVISGLAT